jgi:hypothetical protein
MFTCPANHASETPEFCSVCGLEIPGAAPAAAAAPAPVAAVETMPAATSAAVAAGEACPDCGAPRDSDQQVFCEVCGYNFVTRVAGSGPPPSCVPAASFNPEPAATAINPPPSAVATSPESTVTAPSSAQPVEPIGGVGRPSPNASEVGRPSPNACWELVVTVDANLYGTPNPDAPAGQPPQKFRLFDRETMIGRAGTEVRVQVPIQGDPGVSRRQALLIQGPDSSLLLRDLNSANGTQVDGVDVRPGVDTPLHDGAAIAIGGWTSIVVRVIAS